MKTLPLHAVIVADQFYLIPLRLFGGDWQSANGFWKTLLPLRLTIATLMSDIETEWTLNASLTRLSSYRKCSKRRILGHSAQATSLLQIEGTTKRSHIARGFAFGIGMASVAVADLRPQ